MTDGASFKDHFSAQAGEYERHRPGYPPELFGWLASVAPANERALDLATGNGQAATGLAAHFAEVQATEPSEAQLSRASPHPRISYLRGTAERIGFPDGYFDLLTAAQAAHWFDWPRFYAEARRVLRPGGIIALWTYEMFTTDPEVDAVMDDFYRNVVGPYWPRERRHVEERYTSLPFPFEEIASPPFILRTQWSLSDVLGYLETWSAVQRYLRIRGRNPVELVADPLAGAWGQGERRLSWPIHLRAGRG
jgi:SAM-dependent methyltransferase